MSRLTAIAAGLTALAFLALAAPVAAADRVVLQLHRPAQFEFAGYYAALWEGFYRDAGLDVVIEPGDRLDPAGGAAAIDPVRELISGRAQFGTGTARLVIQAAEGLPLLLMAPVFQQSGAAVYYRADADFSSPAALRNGRIGILPASSILDLELRTALNAASIDVDKLRSVPLLPGQIVGALADRRIDAAIASPWDLPWQARERGLALKSFDPAAYRIAFYGDSLFTLQSFAEDHPATVRRFRAASLAGWDYALQHTDQMAARIVAELPKPAAVSDPAGFARYQSGVARRLAAYPAIPLGQSDPDRWRRIEQSLIEAAAIAHPADLDEFIYQPATPASSRSNRPAAPLFAAAVAIFLLGAALVWRRALGIAAARAATARIGERFTEIQGRVLGALPRLLRFGSLRRAQTSPGADLDAMLTALEHPLRRSLPSSIAFRLSLAPERWLCRADPAPVAAATRDLVAAAIADMPDGGELTLGTRHHTIDAAFVDAVPGDYVRLTIRDNGAGLAPERLDRIFDRAETVRPAVVAAGKLARQQGGFARVESAEGVGTAVHLYFRRIAAVTGPPLAAEPAKAAE